MYSSLEKHLAAAAASPGRANSSQAALLAGGAATEPRSRWEGADALGSRACCLLQIQKSRWDFRDKRWFSQVLEVIEYLVTDSSPEGQLYA
ncbi:unnamed protein product [Caretta caretta]